MPVPPNTVRINIRATLATTEEIVHTIHLERVNTTTGVNRTTQELADRVRDKWTDFLTTAGGGIAVPNAWMRSDLVYRTVDAYELDAAGHATAQKQSIFGATAKGVATGTPMPADAAIVASLRTSIPGRSFRGRLYLGGFVTAGVAAGGTVHTDLAGGLAAGLATFGQAMQWEDAGVDTTNWVVLSKTRSETTRIEEVRVGSLWDTQRRRENGLAQTYRSFHITY